MNILFRIVYAAHARGTHHKLALDALRHLACMDADLWQGLFLRHAELYLEGSKAPDVEFKDFKNHVLHTRDGYWGGAPEKVRSWYNHVVEALAVHDWPTAVYCAGVLSHYYTDPIQPFHTAQSEAENNIHRACEWSISQAYDELSALGEAEFPHIEVPLGNDPNWLPQLVCSGAERANAYYEKLIAHYDFTRGVVDPPAGLDRVAKRIVAELIRYAALSYAAVLGRAIREAGVHPPDVPLLPATLLAAVKVPAKLLLRRIADVEERRLVERIYDELVATGTVERYLPEDDRTVRDLYTREVLSTQAPQPHVSKVFPFKPRETVVTRIDQVRAARVEQEELEAGNIIPLRSAPARQPPAPLADTPERPVPDRDAGPELPARVARPRAGLNDRLDKVVAQSAPRPKAVSEGAANGEARVLLALDDDIVNGPSIGPKTAERLYPHGVRTIRDLLDADPAALAALVGARHIGAETIATWQDQARLVFTIPGLRGTHAQLLVGAGYRSVDAVAQAEPDKLCADILRFAATSAGQRVLRQGDPPDIERIKSWSDAARSVKAA